MVNGDRDNVVERPVIIYFEDGDVDTVSLRGDVYLLNDKLYMRTDDFLDNSYKVANGVKYFKYN